MNSTGMAGATGRQTRRQAGGYEWRNECDKLSHIGEQIGAELTELSRNAPTVEAARAIVRLLLLSNQVSLKSLRLREYQVRSDE